MRRRQQGMTFMGLLIILAMAGLIVYAGIRLTPVYLNYMKVAKAMDEARTQFKGDNPDPGAIHTALERHWEIDMIDSPSVKDVEIVKDEGAVTLHVAYDDAVPYIANVSLSVHFDKTVKVQ